MLKRVSITNFRGLRHFDISNDLKPVTVLLGPNSSGKTTVLHGIRLACQLLDFALSADGRMKVLADNSIEVAKDILIESPAQLLPLADWQALFVDQRVNEGTAFSIVLHFQDEDAINQMSVDVSYARNKQVKFSLKVLAPDACAHVKGVGKNAVSAALNEWLRSHAPHAVFIPPFYGVVKDEEYRPRVVVNRLVGSGDQSHVVRNLISSLESHQLTRLNSFLLDMLGAEISYRTTGDKVEVESPLRVEFKDTNGGIEISAAGAGFINLVALYSSLARWQVIAKNNLVIYLLDEPEAHLHPKLQGSAAERIASLVTEDFGAQLFVATHSVDIINSLGVAENSTLLRIDRSADVAVTFLDGQREIVRGLADWVDLAPFTSINFLASRAILFHEGPTDADVLSKCAKLRYRDNRDLRNKFERWTFSALDGSGNDKAVSMLMRLLQSDNLVSGNGAEKFSIAVVLDKDYHRKSGFDQTSSPAKLVWSCHSLESLFVSDVLAHWICAFVGQGVASNYADLVAAAILAADNDIELLDSAEKQLSLALMKEDLSSEDGTNLTRNSDAHKLESMTQAKICVRKDPSVYQRGKDRARFVLSHIRDHLHSDLKNKFPSDMVKLIKRTDINRIATPKAAIPSEIWDLLEWMVEQ